MSQTPMKWTLHGGPGGGRPLPAAAGAAGHGEGFDVAGGALAARGARPQPVDRHALERDIGHPEAGGGAALRVGDAAEAEQPGQAARGVGATAVAEQEEPVAGAIVRAQPGVGQFHVAGEAETHHPAPHAVEAPGADARGRSSGAASCPPRSAARAPGSS